MILPIPSFTMVAAAAVLAFSAGGLAAWKMQGWRFEAAKSEAAQRATRDLARAVEAQDRAVTEYLKEKEDANVVYRVINEEVERVVTKPVYRNVCLDADGLRALEHAIDGTAPVSDAGAAVPAAAQAEGRSR